MSFSVEKKDNYTLLQYQSSTLDVDAFIAELAKHADAHILADLTSLESIENLDLEPLASETERFSENKKSLIVILKEAHLESFEDYVAVVPTLHEAEDYLEMEDIERKLGF